MRVPQHRLASTSVAALFACLAFGSEAQNESNCAAGPWPSGVPAGAIELAEYPITDLALSKPGQPLPWGSVLAPISWKASPGMRWSEHNSCSRTAQKDRWTVEAGDGSARVSLLPEERWIVSGVYLSGPFSSCPLRSYFSAAPFLSDMVARLAASARGIEVRDRPDILGKRTPEEIAQARIQLRERLTTAAELQFSFTTRDGPRDALLISIVTMTEPEPTIPERDYYGTSRITLYASFPAGQLNRRLIETIRGSGFFNSNWSWKQGQPKQAMADRPNDVRPLGKAVSFGGLQFTSTGVPDVWRSAAGRFYLFPVGAVPASCGCADSTFNRACE
jgi:hypothetical protein